MRVFLEFAFVKEFAVKGQPHGVTRWVPLSPSWTSLGGRVSSLHESLIGWVCPGGVPVANTTCIPWLQMTEYLEQFQQFYLQKHSGRVLKWCHSLGHCLLRAKFRHGQKELDVSFHQTLVLLLFNDTDSLSLEDIASATKIGTVFSLSPSLSEGFRASFASS